MEIKKVKMVTLVGELSALEDLILDLQNEYPEWFVISSKKSNTHPDNQVVKLMKKED